MDLVAAINENFKLGLAVAAQAAYGAISSWWWQVVFLATVYMTGFSVIVAASPSEKAANLWVGLMTLLYALFLFMLQQYAAEPMPGVRFVSQCLGVIGIAFFMVGRELPRRVWGQ